MFHRLSNNRHRRTTIVAAGILFLIVALSTGVNAAHAQETAWNAWYWTNSDLAGDPVLHRLEPEPGLDIGFFEPVEGIPADNFSARWVNVIDVTEATEYTFTARVDDGLRVWVDDNLVIDDWEPQAEHEVSGSTQLTQGRHVIRVEYFDSRDSALLEFDWGPTGVQGQDGQTQELGEEETSFPATVVTATTTANLNLREGPGLQFDILATLAQGSVLGFTGFTDETGQWVLVDAAAGPTGWVSARFLSNVPDQLQVQGAEQEADQTDTATGVSEPDEDETTFPATVVTATTTANLNVREGPGQQFTILATLPRGSLVGFTGFIDTTGQWVQVDAADGPTGWVSVNFLSNVPADLSVWQGMPEGS